MADRNTPTFLLAIELGNDAMRLRAHVATALEEIAARLRNHRTVKEGRIGDANGNRVGQWAFLLRTEDPQELADTVRRNAQVLAHYSGSDAGRAAQATIDEALALLVSMARGNR